MGFSILVKAVAGLPGMPVPAGIPVGIPAGIPSAVAGLAGIPVPAGIPVGNPAGIPRKYCLGSSRRCHIHMYI